MAGINPVIDPLQRKLVCGPEEGQNTTVDGFQVNVIGDTGSGLYNAVAPIDLTGNTFSLALSTVRDILTGAPVIEAIDVSALRGALTAGQAVDVTSQPDGVTGDWRGTFSVTGSLGFASFPKYASGLSYLFLADLTATASGTVTPSGTWLDGTSAAKSLAAGTSARVAMLFNAANKAKFTFSSTGSVSVSNCREYEVTACSAEAVAYIAQLASPDAFASYYLIKPDMVQPWTGIIDMGSSPAVTIASGLSYKLNAATGVHQLTVDTCPAGYDGRDAIIRITLGGSGVIQAVSPLQLGGALVPYAINNCVVRFRDGEAVLLVEDTLAGYVVTVNAGTGEGSLPYGLATTGVPYIAFSPSTDGTPVDLSGATTAAEEVTVVGNGYEETILTGSITCTSKTTVANLALQNVVVSGGTMTLGDAYIPSGSTVAVSGGGLAVEKVTGAGNKSMIDLSGTNIVTASSAFFGGVELVGGSGSPYGGAISNAWPLTLSRCIVSGNNAAIAGGGIYTQASICTVIDSVVSGNGQNIVHGKDIYKLGTGTLAISGSTIGHITIGGGGVSLSGSNTISRIVALSTSNYGSVTISSGATLDLTGNNNATPIAPGGGITLDASPSSGVVIIGSAGSGTQTRTFAGGGTITGSAVTKIGAISGATVTLPSSSCQIEFVKSGETVVSSAFIQASETPYVLETQQGTGAVLVRAIED